MSRLLNSGVSEAAVGNRYYWSIAKVLPKGTAGVRKWFRLHNKKWQYCAYYNFNQKLEIVINYCGTNLNNTFDVQTGIIEASGKEIAMSRAERHTSADSVFIVKGFIGRTEIDSLMLRNDILYLYVEMQKKDDETPKITRIGKLQADYQELLISGKNSDVVIQVKRKKFNCHRCILGARSPVFSAMMEHDMKEKNSGLVNIKDAEPSVFQEFLLYLYSGDDKHLNWKNVTDLYKLGDKYAVEDFKSLCVEYMKKNISADIFYEIFQLSQQHNDSNLKDTTVQFFLKKSKEIIDSEKWLKFLAKNPAECNVLIKALAERVEFLDDSSRRNIPDHPVDSHPLDYSSTFY